MDRGPLFVGYMRISKPSVPNRKGLTPEQYQAEYDRLEREDFETQHAALIAAGCLPEHIFSDRGLRLSHSLKGRVGWQACDAFLQAGDTLVITDQDRVSRTLEDQLALKRELEERGIGFKMLGSSFETTTPEGNMLFQVLGMVAEYMRRNTSRRTKASLQTRKEELAKRNDPWQHLGRPNVLSREQVSMARELYEAGKTPGEIARALKVSRSTIYRWAIWGGG